MKVAQIRTISRYSRN